MRRGETSFQENYSPAGSLSQSNLQSFKINLPLAKSAVADMVQSNPVGPDDGAVSSGLGDTSKGAGDIFNPPRVLGHPLIKISEEANKADQKGQTSYHTGSINTDRLLSEGFVNNQRINSKRQNPLQTLDQYKSGANQRNSRQQHTQNALLTNNETFMQVYDELSTQHNKTVHNEEQ